MAALKVVVTTTWLRPFVEGWWTSTGIDRTNLLAKGEVECVSARIQKLDFKGPVLHRTLLSDQLIEAGFANFTGAIRR
jgi:hypothetical protein